MKVSTYDELSGTIGARLVHVGSRGQELADAIRQWVDANPFSPEAVIAPDRLSWELRLRLPEKPPLTKWGLIFGDAVGGLRSALNNMLWGLSEVEGIALAKPKALQFPIAETRQEWNQQVRWIAELPEVVRQSIERVQPFQRSGLDGLPENDALLLLKRLSNGDKHQLALEPIVDPRELKHGFSVEFRSEEDAAAEGEPQVEIGTSFGDGDVLLRQVTKHPIVKVKGSHSFRAEVVVLDPPHGSVGATSGLAALCVYVDQVCAYVLNNKDTV